TLADRTDRYREALGYIERALDQSPDNPAFVDSMGWVQYRLGDYKLARQYLERALNLANDPEIAAHLGEVLWVSGEQSEAESVWQKALEDFPGSDIVLRTKHRFIE
ncbi:MAG: tetratricopeptide repeat protein, partial [Gammaproteobacteria bacterium]|nr:tetratricopeptide repeat protein [Gammaproteobacteria bacterium]